MPTDQEIRELKAKAIADAIAWWDTQPPSHRYECNQCGYEVVWKEEGSSLFQDWLRCPQCTDKIFPVKLGIVFVEFSGRTSKIPLNELVRPGQVYTKKFLLNAAADWMYEPGVRKLKVRKKKNGDIFIS